MATFGTSPNETIMRTAAAILVSCTALAAQNNSPAPLSVSAVRHWTQSNVTRVAVEVSGTFTYKSDRLHNPERVYYDIPNSKPSMNPKRFYSEDLTDSFVKRIRVAETQPGTTRVVLDLTGPVEISTSQLANPERLIVDLRPVGAPPVTASSLPPVSVPLEIPKPPKTEAAKPEAAKMAPPAAIAPRVEPVHMVDPPRSEPIKVEPIPVSAPETTTVAAVIPPPSVTPPSPPAAISAADLEIPETAKPARRTIEGGTSLVRTLGLKVRRVVIDPGHGGHDQGTEGGKGLLEKELVLDVSLRLGKLIQDGLNAEVIYTRSDDTFIPLEGRTAFANEHKADLFLSVHANSSPSAPQISGVETYYLNFTDSKDSMAVATRENATSQKSIFDLRDIIQAISQHDKAAESRDFAAHVQNALYAFSAHNFPSEKNRGVKKAEFVVLVGANMPSVLAEIGFLSNPKEEALLKKSEYRQKLAEALYHGVSKYAESLSHFQVAQK